MKNLKEYIGVANVNEARRTPVNFYIMNCGAMEYKKEELANAIDAVGGIASVNLFDKDGITPITEHITKIQFEGPHTDKVDAVLKDMEDNHLGELSFIVTC